MSEIQWLGFLGFLISNFFKVELSMRTNKKLIITQFVAIFLLVSCGSGNNENRVLGLGTAAKNVRA